MLAASLHISNPRNSEPNLIDQQIGGLLSGRDRARCVFNRAIGLQAPAVQSLALWPLLGTVAGRVGYPLALKSVSQTSPDLL
jgi:hypothetical protein